MVHISDYLKLSDDAQDISPELIRRALTVSGGCQIIARWMSC